MCLRKKYNKLQNTYVIYVLTVNPLPADHDYCRFKSVWLTDQITTIGNELSV